MPAGDPTQPETFNQFLVGAAMHRNGQPGIQVVGYAMLCNPITPAEALNLAAWLVALADQTGERPQFGRLLRAVMAT